MQTQNGRHVQTQFCRNYVDFSDKARLAGAMLPLAVVP